MSADPLPRIGEGLFFQRIDAIDDVEGGERPSATAQDGTGSSTSSSSTATSSESGATARRKPARTTANR
jgi:hypothetical protein